MEKVADVLDHKYPLLNTVTNDCLVSDALYQMSTANIEHLVVFDDQKFVGIITEHDIASKVLFDNRPLNKIKVKEYVNRTMPVACSDDSVDNCIQLMERYSAKHAAIFDGFTFRGVLSYQDLLKQSRPSYHTSY